VRHFFANWYYNSMSVGWSPRIWGEVFAPQLEEMRARVQEMQAKVIEAQAQVPLAIAQAFKDGNLGVMDFYKMQNVMADTSMRESLAGGDEAPSE